MSTDPTPIVVSEDVVESFMPLGVTDPKRASKRLVYVKGQVIRQDDASAYDATHEGDEGYEPIKTQSLPTGFSGTIGRIIDLDALGAPTSSLPGSINAGDVAQDERAPEARGNSGAPALSDEEVSDLNSNKELDEAAAALDPPFDLPAGKITDRQEALAAEIARRADEGGAA